MKHNIVPAPGGRPWEACRRCLKVMNDRNRDQPCSGLVRLRRLTTRPKAAQETPPPTGKPPRSSGQLK